jgi:hypothetical protein
VSIALVTSRLEAVHLDLDLAAGLRVVVVRALEPAFELVEPPANRRYRQVLGRKSEMRVCLIDFVLDHVVLLKEIS